MGIACNAFERVGFLVVSPSQSVAWLFTLAKSYRQRRLYEALVLDVKYGGRKAAQVIQ